MRLPTWEELNSQPEQLEVLEHPLDRSLFVVGPPGSGKTVLAIHRAVQAAKASAGDDTVPPVAIVTYNRMLRRLLVLMTEDLATEDLNYEDPFGFDNPSPEYQLEIMTMHSFVGRDYRDSTKEDVPTSPHDNYNFIWETMLQTLAAHDRDPDRPHLVVDEGQDIPEGFFQYASRHVSDAMTVFADEDQTLGPRSSTLAQIKAAAGLADPVMLTRNHRNTAEIARLAEHFHRGRLPAAAVVRSPSGPRPRLVRLPDSDSSVTQIANQFENLGGSIGVIVHRNATGNDLYRRLEERLRGRASTCMRATSRTKTRSMCSSPESRC